MYNGIYNPQGSIEKLNEQISNLERIRSQMQQIPPQPVPITQNFQLAPTNRDIMKYASSIDDVQKELVIGDTPYFSKDMSVLWIKNTKGEIKTYELTEIIQKDEKDMQIEVLMAKINELERKIVNEPSDEYVDEPIKDEKSTGFQTIRRNKKQ